MKDAIEKGILCPFDYIPLSYTLTQDEREKKKRIIAAFNAKKENGEPFNENDLYTQLSRVNKNAVNKIDEFEQLIKKHTELLDKCIIFVETMDYGLILQEKLLKYCSDYHTYYADDEKINLERFAEGKINCLLTCKKISEGIDIQSVTNIILFSSDRSKLVTTQRIGRALRTSSTNPNKVATVVDFILEDNRLVEGKPSSDEERKEWLTELSKIRRIES